MCDIISMADVDFLSCDATGSKHDINQIFQGKVEPKDWKKMCEHWYLIYKLQFKNGSILGFSSLLKFPFFQVHQYSYLFYNSFFICLRTYYDN